MNAPELWLLAVVDEEGDGTNEICSVSVGEVDLGCVTDETGCRICSAVADTEDKHGLVSEVFWMLEVFRMDEFSLQLKDHPNHKHR